jgi:hypothetical protein
MKKGLPGGPNEMMYSSKGYLPDSPDRFNPYNVIPSPHITMKGVPFPIYGIDDTCYSQIMQPGFDYKFPGRQVTEYPLDPGFAIPLSRQQIE